MSSATTTLRQRILMPLLGVWLLSLMVIMMWSWLDFRQRLHSYIAQRGELVANAVHYAAETLESAGELQRLVLNLGSERDVLAIVVASGNPGTVLASTAMQWRHHAMADIDPDIAADLMLVSQAGRIQQHYHASSNRFDIVMPLQMMRREVISGMPANGAVLVSMDTRSAERGLLQHALVLFVCMVLVSSGLTLLTGWLLQHHVLRPVETMARVVRQRRRERPATDRPRADDDCPDDDSSDEIHTLASTLDSLFENLDYEERSRAAVERDLRRTNLLYQTILQSADAAIIATDTEGVIQVFNRYAEHLLGYASSEVIGKLTPAAFHDPQEIVTRARQLQHELGLERLSGFDVFVAKTRSSGQPDTSEWNYVSRDGSRVPVSVSIICLKDDQDNVSGYLGIAHNISRLKRAHQRLQQVIEATSSGILLADRHGSIRMVNSSVERMFGYAPGELLGQPVERLVPERARERHAGNRQDYMADPGPRDMGRDLRGLRKDGSELDIEIGLTPVESDDGLQTICTIADMTLRKQRERELYEARQTAEAANRVKSEFLAVMSHEIRTPMNGMLGIAQLLARTTLDAQQREYVGMIRDSGGVLISLINDILDFSKIEAGRLQLETRPFDLAAEVDACVQLMRFRAEEKRLQLHCEHSWLRPSRVMGDSHRLRQVLLNLLSNAIKFTTQGSVTVSVTYALANGITHVRISVQDTGRGIARDKQDRLFEPFSQVDSSTTREHGGTGLGLAISQKIVEAMHGRIHVESAEGAGACFWFALALPLASGEIEASRGVAGADVVRQSVAGRTVLVVEDVEINRVVAENMLREAGCRVLQAVNGREALEALQAEPVDLVLMDCQMPEMDGFEATRQIRAAEKTGHLPVIALTANVTQDSFVACLAAGMDDVLTKPYQEADLIGMVARHLTGATRPPLATGAAEEPDATAVAQADASTPFGTFCTRLGAERAGQLLAAFAQSARQCLADLADARSAGEVPAMQRALHSLKSAAGTFGLADLSQLAAQWESRCQEQACPVPPEIADQLEALLAQGLAGLEAVLQDMRASSGAAVDGSA